MHKLGMKDVFIVVVGAMSHASGRILYILANTPTVFYIGKYLTILIFSLVSQSHITHICLRIYLKLCFLYIILKNIRLYNISLLADGDITHTLHIQKNELCKRKNL